MTQDDISDSSPDLNISRQQMRAVQEGSTEASAADTMSWSTNLAVDQRWGLLTMARFSLLSLMLFVAGVAVMLALLRVASELLASFIFMLAVVTLSGAGILALFGRRSVRPLYGTFALVGFLYIGLSMCTPNSDGRVFTSPKHALLTSKILDQIYDQIAKPATQPTFTELVPRPSDFYLIGHSLFALLLGLLGLSIARWVLVPTKYRLKRSTDNEEMKS